MLPGLHLDFRLREQNGALLTDGLQIHLLELAKAPPARDNLVGLSPAEQWAQFLLHVDELAPEEVERQFPDREFIEAAGVLEMISRSTDQRTAYDLRLKAERDERARLLGAQLEAREIGREEGRGEGYEIGLLAGRVQILQEMLGRQASPSAELTRLSLIELSALADALRKEIGRPAG